MATEAFRQALLELSAEYRSALPAKMAELEAQWRDGAPGSVETLRRGLHTLAGSAKTFGLAEVTDAARAAEQFLDPFCERGTPPEAAARAEFEGLFEALKRVALAPPRP
jgi:chemotaxis protein histidine kinase CheA